MNIYAKLRSKGRKQKWVFFLWAALFQSQNLNASCPIRIILDQPPLSLNPRQTLDATGQKLNALLHRALTRFDSHLNPIPDLALSWRSEQNEKIWAFKLPDPAKAKEYAQCLLNYHSGKPLSLIAKSITGWKKVYSKQSEVILEFDQPKPQLPSDLSLLYLFKTAGHSEPCLEPDFQKLKNHEIQGEGDYLISPATTDETQKIILIPKKNNLPELHFQFPKDQNLRVFYALKNETDVIFNSLSTEKLVYLQEKLPKLFTTLFQEGTTVHYIGFNLKDPILKNQKVRLAIAHAIDRPQYLKTKLKDFTTITHSLLSKELKESSDAELTPISYQPELSQKILDEAGFLVQKNGFRFSLLYRTTSIKEAQDLALFVREMLKHIQINMTIQLVEPAAFLGAIRKGNYQMYASRWVGIKDVSILHRTLHSRSSDNRNFYQNSQMDEWLEKHQYANVQKKILEDLPFFPLWTWNNAAFMRKTLEGITPSDMGLDGSLHFLKKLRWSQCPQSEE